MFLKIVDEQKFNRDVLLFLTLCVLDFNLSVDFAI